MRDGTLTGEMGKDPKTPPGLYDVLVEIRHRHRVALAIGSA